MDRDDQMILSLLSAVEEDSRTTQSSLATRLGVGVGLVNSYMKRVIYKGYIKTKRLERRRLLYLLTPSGIKEKSRLTLEFLHYSYQFLRDVRLRIHQILKPHVSNGVHRIVIYGSGEIVEVAYLALTEIGLKLHAIVDERNQGKRCLNYQIQTIEWLASQEEFDLILALQSPDKDTIQERLIEIAREKSVPIEQFVK